MLDKRNFYINGKWIEPSKPNNFEVINPEIIGDGHSQTISDFLTANTALYIKQYGALEHARYALNDPLTSIIVFCSRTPPQTNRTNTLRIDWVPIGT